MWFTEILSSVRGGHEPVVFVLVCLDASWSAAFALRIHFVQRLKEKKVESAFRSILTVFIFTT